MDQDIQSKEDIFNEFIKKLIESQEDIDPEIAEIVNKNYFDLLY